MLVDWTSCEVLAQVGVAGPEPGSVVLALRLEGVGVWDLRGCGGGGTAGSCWL